MLQFLFADDIGNFVVTAFCGHDHGLGILPVRPDSAARVRAAFHQQAHHCGIAPLHRDVERQPFRVAGPVAIHQLRPPMQQVANGIRVPSLHGIVKPADRHTVYTRFEFWPTVEPIRAGQYE
jgi:hypothetical protein